MKIKLNTVLLIILIALVGVGVVYLVLNKKQSEIKTLDLSDLTGQTQNNQNVNTVSQNISPDSDTTLNGITCHNRSKYFVITRDDKNSAGSDILIKYKNNPDQIIPCNYVVEKNDFELKNDGAQWFSSLVNNLLILDNGTSAGVRELVIYDLDQRKEVFNETYYAGGGSFVIKDNTITYWFKTNTVVTAQNCLKFFNQGSGAIVAHIVLDLSTLTKKDLGENKCAYQE